MEVSMPTLCENHRCNKRAKNEIKKQNKLHTYSNEIYPPSTLCENVKSMTTKFNMNWSDFKYQ